MAENELALTEITRNLVKRPKEVKDYFQGEYDLDVNDLFRDTTVAGLTAKALREKLDNGWRPKAAEAKAPAPRATVEKPTAPPERPPEADEWEDMLIGEKYWPSSTKGPFERRVLPDPRTGAYPTPPPTEEERRAARMQLTRVKKGLGELFTSKAIPGLAEWGGRAVVGAPARAVGFGAGLLEQAGEGIRRHSMDPEAIPPELQYVDPRIQQRELDAEVRRRAAKALLALPSEAPESSKAMLGALAQKSPSSFAPTAGWDAMEEDLRRQAQVKGFLPAVHDVRDLAEGMLSLGGRLVGLVPGEPAEGKGLKWVGSAAAGEFKTGKDVATEIAGMPGAMAAQLRWAVRGPDGTWASSALANKPFSTLLVLQPLLKGGHAVVPPKLRRAIADAVILAREVGGETKGTARGTPEGAAMRVPKPKDLGQAPELQFPEAPPQPSTTPARAVAEARVAAQEAAQKATEPATQAPPPKKRPITRDALDKIAARYEHARQQLTPEERALLDADGPLPQGTPRKLQDLRRVRARRDALAASVEIAPEVKQYQKARDALDAAIEGNEAAQKLARKSKEPLNADWQAAGIDPSTPEGAKVVDAYNERTRLLREGQKKLGTKKFGAQLGEWRQRREAEATAEAQRVAEVAERERRVAEPQVAEEQRTPDTLEEARRAFNEARRADDEAANALPEAATFREASLNANKVWAESPQADALNRARLQREQARESGNAGELREADRRVAIAEEAAYEARRNSPEGQVEEAARVAWREAREKLPTQGARAAAKARSDEATAEAQPKAEVAAPKSRVVPPDRERARVKREMSRAFPEVPDEAIDATMADLDARFLAQEREGGPKASDMWGRLTVKKGGKSGEDALLQLKSPSPRFYLRSERLPLLEQRGGRALGSYEYTPAEGMHIIRGFQGADIGTLVHEVGHFFRRSLSNALRAEAEAVWRVEKGEWTRAKEEAFANDFMRWRRTGVAQSPQAVGIFQRFMQWLRDVWSSFKSSESVNRITPEARTFFEKMLGEETPTRTRRVLGGTELREPPEAPLEPTGALGMLARGIARVQRALGDSTAPFPAATPQAYPLMERARAAPDQARAATEHKFAEETAAGMPGLTKARATGEMTLTESGEGLARAFPAVAEHVWKAADLGDVAPFVEAYGVAPDKFSPHALGVMLEEYLGGRFKPAEPVAAVFDRIIANVRDLVKKINVEGAIKSEGRGLEATVVVPAPRQPELVWASATQTFAPSAGSAALEAYRRSLAPLEGHERRRAAMPEERAQKLAHVLNVTPEELERRFGNPEYDTKSGWTGKPVQDPRIAASIEWGRAMPRPESLAEGQIQAFKAKYGDGVELYKQLYAENLADPGFMDYIAKLAEHEAGAEARVRILSRKGRNLPETTPIDRLIRQAQDTPKPIRAAVSHQAKILGRIANWIGMTETVMQATIFDVLREVSPQLLGDMALRQAVVARLLKRQPELAKMKGVRKALDGQLEDVAVRAARADEAIEPSFRIGPTSIPPSEWLGALAVELAKRSPKDIGVLRTQAIQREGSRKAAAAASITASMMIAEESYRPFATSRVKPKSLEQYGLAIADSVLGMGEPPPQFMYVPGDTFGPKQVAEWMRANRNRVMTRVEKHNNLKPGSLRNEDYVALADEIERLGDAHEAIRKRLDPRHFPRDTFGADPTTTVLKPDSQARRRLIVPTGIEPTDATMPLGGTKLYATQLMNDSLGIYLSVIDGIEEARGASKVARDVATHVKASRTAYDLATDWNNRQQNAILVPLVTGVVGLVGDYAIGAGKKALEMLGLRKHSPAPESMLETSIARTGQTRSGVVYELARKGYEPGTMGRLGALAEGAREWYGSGDSLMKAAIIRRRAPKLADALANGLEEGNTVVLNMSEKDSVGLYRAEGDEITGFKVDRKTKVREPVYAAKGGIYELTRAELERAKRGEDPSLVRAKLLDDQTLSDFLARSASQTGSRLLGDYADIGTLPHRARSSTALGLLGIVNPWLTWGYKMLDIPFVKRGLLAHSLFGFDEFGWTNSPGMRYWYARDQVGLGMRRAFWTSAVRGHVLQNPEREEIRDAFSRYHAALPLIVALADNSVSYQDTGSSYFFAPTETMIRAIWGGGTRIADALGAYDFEKAYPVGSDLELLKRPTSDMIAEGRRLWPDLTNEGVKTRYTEEYARITATRAMLLRMRAGRDLNAAEVAKMLGLAAGPTADVLLQVLDANRRGEEVRWPRVIQSVGATIVGGTPYKMLSGLVLPAATALATDKTPDEAILGYPWLAALSSRANEMPKTATRRADDFIAWNIRIILGWGVRSRALIAANRKGPRDPAVLSDWLIDGEKALRKYYLGRLVERAAQQQVGGDVEGHAQTMRAIGVARHEIERQKALLLKQYEELGRAFGVGREPLRKAAGGE